MTTTPQKIVFFDGVCGLCNQTIDFIIQQKTTDLYFASLQSDFASTFLADYQVDTKQLDTFYFFNEGQLYNRSDAALQVAQYLKSPYRWLMYFGWIPRFVRNSIYNFIAKNRYRWFGKKESCRLPNPAEKMLFLG